MLASSLPIYRDMTELSKVLIFEHKEMPNMYKNNLGNKVVETALECLYSIEVINKGTNTSQKKLELIDEFIAKFDFLKTLIKLCVEIHILNIKREAYIATFTAKISKQVNGWRSSIEKREQ